MLKDDMKALASKVVGKSVKMDSPAETEGDMGDKPMYASMAKDMMDAFHSKDEAKLADLIEEMCEHRA